MKFSVKTLATTALALMTISSAWANKTSFTGASISGDLGYHRATVDYTDSVFASGSTQLNGVGYGVGAAYAVARNVELEAELQRINFNSGSSNASIGKPPLTQLMLKAAYRL